jgi:hypothetical protein
MKLSLDNGTQVNLTKRNFLASGGEGDIYVKGQVAYKIYHDPKNMLPLGKIKELGDIKDNNIIRPQNICISSKNIPVGYTMRYVSDTYPLVQCFTKAFRERNGLSHDKIRELVKKLRERVLSVHKANILIVDLNEMNFLVANKFNEIFGIDTDSYQTKSYPATAIMESIRDRHNKNFSKNTDWFSFAIISFIMFTGIHPFKGKHPSIKTMDDRMKSNISVLDKNVRVPKVCYDFSLIPKSYFDWYSEVFQNGIRSEPPETFDAIKSIAQFSVRKIVGSNNFIIEEIIEVKGDIVNVHSHGTNRILTTSHFFHKGGANFKVSHPVVSFKDDIDGSPILAKTKNNKLSLFDANSQSPISVNMAAEDVMVAHHPAGSCRLYVKSGESILKLEFVGKKKAVTFQSVANILNKATRMFDGVFVQELLGATYLSFFPDPIKHIQFHMDMLDGYRIVDGKYDNGCMMILAMNLKTGKYDRFVYRFSKDFKSYDLRKVENVSLTAINFVTLDTGVVICLNEEESLEAFSNQKNSGGVKIIDDPILGGDMRLHRLGGRAYFSRGNKLFSISMNKS